MASKKDRTITTKRVDRCITRYEGKINGLMVRVTRQGKTHSKFFNFREGKRKALLEARSWRDAKTAKLPPASSNRGRVYSNNTSGMSGVMFVEQEDKWLAQWMIEGEKFKMSFTVSKWGMRKGKRLAKLARELETRDREKVIQADKRNQKRKKK